MSQSENNNKSLKEEIAWLIVERMNDSVGFDEAYQEVGDYLKIIEKRIDSLYQSDENLCLNTIEAVKEMLK